MKRIHLSIKTILFIILLITIIFIIIYITKTIFNIKEKKSEEIKKPIINNSLLLIWDIHCKQNMMSYLNNNNISYKITESSDIGTILIINTNYYCFMSKHPQGYDKLNILINEIINVIKKNKLKSVVSFSTAGSNTYSIGDVIQFNSAIIKNPQQYDLNFNYIKSNNVLYKTNKFTNEPITDTKGFILQSKGQIASGQDEIVVYMVGNKINIPVLTLTGISDENNIQEYNIGGGNLAAQNIIDFFFESFEVL